MVTNSRPLESWQISLINEGNLSAKNPIVKIRFKEAYFEEITFPGWQAVEHVNALGWFFQWTPKLGESQVVHPGFPYQIPTMYFANSTVSDDFKIEVFIAADGMGAISYEVPVRLEYY